MRFLFHAVERAHGIGAEIAVDADIGLDLECLHGIAHGVVIDLVVLVAGNVQALAQRHYPLVLHADVQGLAFADTHEVRLLFVLGLGRQGAFAQFGELGLERLEFLLRRIVAVEGCAHVAGVGELGQHLLRLRRDRLEFDVGADAAEVNLPGLSVARISEHRSGELQFVFGQRAGGRRRFEIRRRIIGGVEPIGIDLAEIGDRALGALVGGAVAHPQRLVVARFVERLDALAVGLAADDAVKLAGDHVAQLIGDRAVGGGGHRGGGHSRGFRRLGCRCSGVLLGLGRLRRNLGGLGRCRAGSCSNILGGQRRQQVGIRHRHRRIDLLVGLLRHAGMASKYQDQAESGRGQQAVKSGSFHQGVSQRLCGGHGPPMPGHLIL